ncbi:MAG TPA: hypothetical protein VF266_15350 [Thermoanaerobaculia bacterium]
MTRDLATLQREMAELIRGGAPPSGDAYLAGVQQSAELKVLRECIAEWRELVLRRACPLTVELLRARGTFEPAVRRLLRRACPPFRHELALAFLAEVAADADPRLAQVAAFEAEMIRLHN